MLSASLFKRLIPGNAMKFKAHAWRRSVSNVAIFDTTLRDGEQASLFSLTRNEKIEIAHKLKDLNVDIMEVGFPVASAGEFHTVKAIADEVKDVTICALARAVDNDIQIAGEALRNAVQRRIHVFIATSDVHLKHKLGMTRNQVLKRAVDAVKFARTFTNDVQFGAEDATRTDHSFLAKIIENVINAGATTINLADTVGYTTPDEFKKLIAHIKENVKNIHNAVLSVHCHNDLGLATANSLSGVQCGARQVECTINGIGERAGNCALEEFVMAIKTRKDIYDFQTNIRTEKFANISEMVSKATGMVVQYNKAIVGKNAFAHRSGIHQHGVLVNSETYEIIDPQTVGFHNKRLHIGKHSGHHAIEDWLCRNRVSLNEVDVHEFLREVKSFCDVQKQASDDDLFKLFQMVKMKKSII